MIHTMTTNLNSILYLEYSYIYLEYVTLKLISYTWYTTMMSRICLTYSFRVVSSLCLGSWYSRHLEPCAIIWYHIWYHKFLIFRGYHMILIILHLLVWFHCFESMISRTYDIIDNIIDSRQPEWYHVWYHGLGSMISWSWNYDVMILDLWYQELMIS